MYEVDLYTSQGSIIQAECQNVEDVFEIISKYVDSVQLINISKL